MRPVTATKGGQPVTYPWNINTNYSASTFTFGQGNATAATNLWNTVSPTKQQVFDGWTYVAKVKNKQAKRKFDHDDYVTVAKAAKGQCGTIYRNALNPLKTALGNYCSYCERPLADRAQVEHICAEEQYPQWILSWDNFLLACPFCNGTKSDDPERSTVKAQFLVGNNNPTEADYYNAILNNYTWPDNFATTYRDIPATLEYYDVLNGAWTPLDTDTVAIMQGTRCDPTDFVPGGVQGDVFLQTTDVNTTNCAVRVTVAGAAAADARMVTLYKLNIHTEKQDYRVGERTQAWFEVLAQLDLLTAFAGDQNGFDKAWARTLAMATRTGYYSVWVLIFDATDARDPSNARLVTRFVTETNLNGPYFNTNTAQVP